MNNLYGQPSINIDKVLNLLDRWGDDGIIVMSQKSLNELMSQDQGSLRNYRGEKIEVKRFTPETLRLMAEENDKNLLNRIEKWLDTGRLAGAGHNGNITFRENIATMLAPEISITVKNYHKMPSSSERSTPISSSSEVIQGKVQAISQADYDAVKTAIEAIRQSLTPVEIQQTEKHQTRSPLHREDPVGATKKHVTQEPLGPQKGINKKRATSTHISESNTQKEANRKRRQEEKLKAQKHKAKIQRYKERIEFDQKQTEIKTGQIKTDQKR